MTNSQEKVTKARDGGIELLRCLLMFGICLLHAMGFGARCYWMAKALGPCVVAFVFISGYYGVRFSVAKLVRIVALGVFCAAISAVAIGAMQGFSGWRSWYDVFWSVYKSYWFLHAYVVVMLFAPVVNAAVEHYRHDARALISVLLPVILFSYAWGFLYSFRALQCVVPGTPGLSTYGGFTLLSAYAAARLYRIMEIDRRLGFWSSLVALALVAPLVSTRFGSYDSLLSLAWAALVFTLFKKITFRGGVFSFLAPSMFSIYLLHTNQFFLPRLETITTRASAFLHCPTWLAAVCVAIAVFATCLTVDLLRRAVVSVLPNKGVR